MAFSTPSYATIRDRMLADVDASLAASGSTRGVVEYAIVSAVSVAALLLHVTIARIARNSVPSKAEAWLMRLWAAFFGITPKSATQHTGTATFVADTGASIPAGTSLRLRNGTEFTTDAEGNESGGTIVVAFTATAYGPAGRSATGVAIFLGSPISGVTTDGTSSEIVGGTDAESDASVLARLLDRLRDPPKGGTEADYVRWVKATEGLTVQDVWVYNSTTGINLYPSTVQTIFTVEPTVGNSWDPVPTSGEVALVQAYVKTLIPVDLIHYVAQGAASQDLDPDIQIDPYPSSAVQERIETALREMLLAQSTPGGVILLSQINEAIASATGLTDHVLISPASNVTAADETIIVLGTASFSAIPGG